jgi:hypothetical protein
VFPPAAVPKPTAGAPCFVSAEQFAANWRVFTMGQLEGLDWRGVFAAGGAVLACATTPPRQPRAADAARTAQLLCRAGINRIDPSLRDAPAFLSFHDRAAPGDLACADIDLWLHGLSPADAAKKVEHIGDVLRAHAAKRGAQLFAARTKHTVTFFSAYPFRLVQVVLAVFASPVQVLLDFDLDCAAIGFDGAALAALPRCVNAVTAGANVMRTDLASHSLKRSLKYAARGVGLALPTALRVPPSARGAADVFAVAKLGLLLARRAPLTLESAAAHWRDDATHGDFFPHASTDPPPETWTAGFTAPGGHFQVSGSHGPRGLIHVAGPDAEYDEDGGRYGKPAHSSTGASASLAAAVQSACALVASLYGTLRRGVAVARTYEDEPPDFPALLRRPTDYGEATPDVPYGPPLPTDTGRGAVRPLDLTPPDPFDFGAAPRRPPVSAAETAAMIAAFAPPPTHPYQPAGITLAKTPEALRALLQGGAAFRPAQFADVLAAGDATAGDVARIRVQTDALPPIAFPTTGRLRSGAEALAVTHAALGGSWRIALHSEAACGGGGPGLVVQLTMLIPPPATPSSSFLTLPAPGGGRVLPLNVVLEFGGSGVFLDTHIALAADDAAAAGGAPRAWLHFVWWSHLRAGELRVHLQAVRLLPEE